MADHKRMLKQARNYLIEAELDCRRMQKPKEIINRIQSIAELIDDVRNELEAED